MKCIRVENVNTWRIATYNFSKGRWDKSDQPSCWGHLKGRNKIVKYVLKNVKLENKEFPGQNIEDPEIWKK